ncbi:hypothetical protein A3B51_00630 [Candidatus Curtissbacteria bacterium RIFCSPLOWO2_01_FULL_41_18]|uniref:DUF2304 domain-containing protein n=1 Tax=Candidatus Curtissbacteria bacterium RIFCSPLOWO2_01_FULL_41_18 TaxID=1797727 RepID=A0A1F5HI03_9BACT|nr:MAG: hypothetical protein A3B51_00630 [Candidatus Curtissbacteria bacterium RIFCSPLOWO2_01_FULL_41_18]
MLTSIQIVLLIFILFALSRVMLRLREKILSTQVAFFWIIVWIAALVGILLPATTSKLAQFFGVGRGVDVIVYISLTLLFYLVFRIYVMIEDLRHEITEIVRHIALQKTIKSPRKNRSKKIKK